ncbi:MAG: metallophosphoesterase [Lachnospiraceae bacterium]|nr:metallophosphoesterase [Lachnospiraceae bacterium]
MHILIVGDEPSKKYWDYYQEGSLDEFDLIISVGDLPAPYLSFMVTFAKCPLLYVSGNHDAVYDTQPPEGCVCIDDDLIVYKGIRILGLGGSYRYKPGPCQYTEKEMRRRIARLFPKIFLKKGFDILVTHSPAKDLNDGEDLPHRGFECFNKLIDKYKPKYFLHGHVHMNYGRSHPRECMKGETKVINGYISHVIDI